MMAASENGTELSGDFDIEDLINAADVDDKDVSAVVSSIHQELNSVKAGDGGGGVGSQDSGLESMEDTPSDVKNGLESGHDPSEKLASSSQTTVKTRGEPSSASSTATASGLTLNLSSLQPGSKETANESASRRGSLSSMSPFGGFTPHNPHTQLLTAEEQAAIYKQASLLAIYAMSSKNGATKAKEMLAVVTKVKNFLTNLVQLAGNSGPQVKTAVHSLVQKLVAGSITEEEFAKKIEEDLKSKHQPDLLPFLQGSVPDLRTHLHIQKEYMKQLVDKKVQEKQHASLDQSTTGTSSSQDPSSSTVSTNTTLSQFSPKQQQVKSATPEPAKPVTQVPPSASPQTTPLNALNLTSMGISLAQQQALKVQLAKLPEEQRKATLEKLLYNRQLQMVIQKQIKGVAGNLSGSPSMVTATTAGGKAHATTQQQLSVLMRQQKLINEQQQKATLAISNNQLTVASSDSSQRSASPRKGGLTGLIGKLKGNKDESPGSPGGKPRPQDEEDEEEPMDNIAGVNLKEETAHFLPTTLSESPTQSCTDEVFLATPILKNRVQSIAHRYGITDVTDEYLMFLSHATEERLRNVVERVTVSSLHRTESLKEDNHYESVSDIRGQVKILERIDEISATRKQEREKEKIIKAAKSRSKQDDPELVKMKEQAKQIQIAEEREIHQKAANVQALAAIGRRKRTAQTAFGGDTSSSSSLGSSDSSLSISSVFKQTPAARTNRQKRRILAKDVLLTMEQDRETRHSHMLYKSLLN